MGGAPGGGSAAESGTDQNNHIHLRTPISRNEKSFIFTCGQAVESGPRTVRVVVVGVVGGAVT